MAALVLSARTARAANLTGPGLALCAGLHLLVDAGCGVLLWSQVHSGAVSGSAAWVAFATYTVLAFAVQPILAVVVDRGTLAWGAVAAGPLMVAAALGLLGTRDWPLALVLAGLGNAVFHLGGGALSLRMAPGRASAPGLFVAPGAAGVVLGALTGRGGAPAWPFALLLVLGALAVPGVARHPGRPGAGPVWPAREGLPARNLDLVLGLLLLVVAVRSFVSMGLVLPWRSDPTLMVALTGGIVAGKALGGVLADRVGWRWLACGAVAVSTPLLAAAAAHPVVGILAMTIFTMTMPVTVAAAARLMPGHEGFALGLTCLALFAGAVPAYLGWAAPVGTAVLVATACLTAPALWIALDPRVVLPEAQPTTPGPGTRITP